MASMQIATSRALLISAVLAAVAQADCLCCVNDQTGRDEGFCKWWSAKHSKVEALGMEAVESTASFEAKKLYVAYFRTHARLEDPLMWNLFRECSAFNSTEHEPLLQANEHEELEIKEGLDVLAVALGVHLRASENELGLRDIGNCNATLATCSQGFSTNMTLNKSWSWAAVQAKVAAHITSEEQLLKGSGLLDACEAHLDRRWTEVMEETHQDAQILYEEFRSMDLSLALILNFVRGMVADWPSFPELRQRTALRMRQVRHRMPQMLDSDQYADILSQVGPSVLMEYVRWIQLERAEGLVLNLREEAALHAAILQRLAAHTPCLGVGISVTPLLLLLLVVRYFNKFSAK